MGYPDYPFNIYIIGMGLIFRVMSNVWINWISVNIILKIRFLSLELKRHRTHGSKNGWTLGLSTAAYLPLKVDHGKCLPCLPAGMQRRLQNLH